MRGWTLAAATVLVWGAEGVPARAEQPAATPLPADRVPASDAQRLSERMHRHGAELQELTHAVTVLDRRTIAETADRIRLDTGLTVGLDGGVARSPRFQQLDQQLRERLTALATAARSYDDAALAPAFGRTMETCVSCHVAFLKPARTPR